MSELSNLNNKYTKELMENIKDLLNTYLIKIGMSTIPTLQDDSEADTNMMGIREIIEVVNDTVDKIMYPQGLYTKSRRRDLVMKKQIVSYICRCYGFQLHRIAKEMNVTHATIIHSVTTVKNLLKRNDPEMLPTYQIIIIALTSYYREKYGKDLPKIN